MEYCNAVFEFMIIYAGDLKTDIFSKLVVAVALELRVKIDRKMNTFIYICSSELTDKLSFMIKTNRQQMTDFLICT